MSDGGIPVLNCTLDDDGLHLTTERCPHCGARHRHGSTGRVSGFQHRAAHCKDGGPKDEDGKPTGYYIRWGDYGNP